jgi:8-oxo-dGTP pyrophosphatase MutT (NUDIX family)
MDRSRLPYRETSDCFIFYRGKVVCRVVRNKTTNSEYLSFPGGGVDKGESILAAAKRECMEEVGAKLSSLKLVASVHWDWFPEWADNPKRQQRYKQFRGELVHILVGTVDKFVKPTSTEGDDWKGKKLMSLAAVLKKHKQLKDHPNMYPYRMTQYSVLSTLNLIKSKNVR